MSTIASLISLIDPSAIKPYSEGVQSATQAQTGLRNLADLKAKQQAEALVMERIKNDPELRERLFGGSVLGSIGPAGGMPASGGAQSGPITQSPLGGGQAQQIPASPDLSQFATQGAPPPQSTIASLGPAGQSQPQARNPLLEMAATNPRAALMLYDRQTKMQEQRLDMGAKVAGGIARIIQGVTDQNSLEQAREQVAQIDPRAAAQLPQFYSKEALEPWIKRAFTAQETADIRLKTWHQQTEERKNQLEEMKIGIQLQNAGYQGLGTDVTSILRGLKEDQVKQFGGRTTAPAVAYATELARKVAGMSDTIKTELGIMKVNPIDATADDLAQAQKNIQARDLGKAGESERQRGQTERELRGEKTLSETMGTKATNLFDTQTMEPVDTRMKQKDYESLPAGQVRELSPQLTEQITNIRTSVPIIEQLQGHIDKIYGPGGVLARMTSDERTMLTNAPSQWAKQYAEKYPELIQAQRFISSNTSSLARALAGEKGAMAEGDVARAEEMLPQLKTALTVWPPTAIGWRQPDTRGVALRSMNSIVDMINGRVRTILGNEKFTHPKLHRYETAEEAQTAAGGTVSAPPVEPPGGPPPTPPPAAGPPIFPRTPLREPGAPPPGQQSQAQPGRRGIELARASGIKVMDRQDIAEAVAETGRSEEEVIAAARAKGYRIYGGGTAMA